MISAVKDVSTYQPLFDTSSTNGTKSTTVADPPTGPTGLAAPSTPNTATPLSNALGKDDFMKLLVAQLKNQDPLNPMDGKDMAAQLAQFSSVEQLMQLNKNATAQAESQSKVADALTALQKGQSDQGDTLASLIQGQMAVSTVGKVGVTNGHTVYVDRDGSGSVTIDSGKISGTGTMSVTDASGKVVATGDVSNVKAGLQNINLADIGFKPPLKNGSYTYSFSVKSADNVAVDAKTYTTGRITGLRYENGSPVLMVGDSLSIPFSQLIQVRN